jgi:hypothetical protein
MAAIPVAQPIASARSVSGGSGPSSATICASVAPGTDSVIRYGRPPSKPASRILATQKGGTRRATRASAVNRSLVAASAARSAASSVTITVSPSTRWARNTAVGPASPPANSSMRPVSR